GQVTMSTASTRPVLDHVRYLECLVCGRRFTPDEVDYLCPDHGDDGILDVIYDHERIAAAISPASLAGDRDPSMWRYKRLLPVDPAAVTPPLRVGWTPLYHATRLAAELGLAHVWVKDEGVQPTGSLKDRASAVAVVKAQERGAEVVTTASTGNAAAALAGVAASVGQPTVILVPATAPEAKVAQLLAYGATVVLVEGTYGDAFELSMRAAEEFGWYVRNTGVNPYMSEGKKTAAFEIAEQLDWQIPDVVTVGVGDGCIIGGLHKGFRDLLALGWVDRIPRLLGVQAEGSDYLTQAWESAEDVVSKPAIDASTVADSISAGLPADRIRALRAVQDTGGAFVRVSDEQILAAIPTLAQGCGVFAEPASAAAYAGLEQAVDQGLVGRDERAVVLATGTGLKDVPAAMRAIGEAEISPVRVAPRMDALAEALASHAASEGR
ncbi:MAG: threonine synthase, partial [Nitriliruptoraceae bacterium]